MVKHDRGHAAVGCPPIRRRRGQPPKLTPTDELMRTVRGLGTILCTVREVAAVLQVSVSTLLAFFHRYPAFRQAFEDGKLNGRAELRRKQWKLADNSAAMAIFLGKNLLGQRDDYRLEAGPTLDLSALTDSELDLLISLIVKASTPSPSGGRDDGV